MNLITSKISQELNIPVKQVTAAVNLLDEGATVPFISRYRKEVTGGLDDIQMRQLEERLGYRREMEERREAILKSVSEQGKLTSELEAQLRSADNKTALEDLYLPYKPKRRTKAQIAREAGLEPLAIALLEKPSLDPVKEAKPYLNIEHKIETEKDALDGAKQILMVVGTLLVLIGAIIHFNPVLLSWFGKLPGDINIQNEHSRIFVPITSMIIVSIIGTLLLNVLKR